MKTTSTSGTNAIKIWEPRYHDKTVLVMTSRIVPGEDIYIEIERGHHKGLYWVGAEDLAKCTTELKESKAGNVNKFTVIPMSKMATVVNEDEFDDFLKEIDELLA